jgi:hypothetical protein
VIHATDPALANRGFSFDQVTVTDITSQEADTQSDFCIVPSPVVTLTLSVTDGITTTPVLPGDTVRNPVLTTLVMEWAPSSGASGIASYEAAWSQEATLPAPGAMTSYLPGDQLVHEQTAHEASAWFAHLVIVDGVGNRTEQRAGPIYIDAPTTPDYINPDDGLTPTVYRGWMESGCSQIGTSQEASVEQKMYLTWDAANLRIAWVGADWDVDGDLFIYLDTGPGGAAEAYDPYGSATSIGLPSEGGNQLAADYLLVVEDATSATLYSWDGAGWLEDQALASPNYLFEDGITDLYLPLSWIGSPFTVRLVALASEDSALRLWAGMPGPNPHNSARSVNSVALPYLDTPFSLTQNYDWSNVGGSGNCPLAGQFENSDPAATITSTPDGLEAGFLEHDLPGLTIPGSRLDADSDGVVDLNQDANPSNDLPLSGNATPLLPGSTVDYTLRVTNDGAGDATGVQVVLAAYGAMSLSAGSNAVNNLGTIPAGGFVDLLFSTDVNPTSRGGEVTAVVSDSVHGEFDWLWAVHSVNLNPTLSNVAITDVNENGVAILTANIDDVGTQGSLALNVDWGDGSATSTFTYPAATTAITETHRYLDDDPSGTTVDTYTVDLTLTDDGTGSDTDSITVTVTNLNPTLSNAAITDVNENGVATLTANIADVGTQDSFALNVDWGDGSAASTFTYPAATTVITETHQYLDDNPSGTAVDSYTVSLTLTDDDTGSDTDSTTVTVTNQDPTLSNVAITDVNENGIATLTADIGDVGTQDSFALNVNWGDGSAVSTFAYPAATTAITETHQFLDDDTYTVSLTLTDDDTGSTTDSTTVTVTNQNPTLSNVAITDVNEDGVAILTGNIADVGTQDSFTLNVNWGDGSAASTFAYPAATTAITETHRFLDDNPSGTAVDNYTVSLTLADDDTGSDADSTTVTVTNVAPVVSADVASQGVQYSDVITDVIISGVDVAGDPLLASTSWSVDSGSFVSGLPTGLILTANSCPISGNGRTCTWTLTGIAEVSAGTYVVRVTIDDDDLGQTSIDRTIVVVPEDATVAFDGSNPVSELVDTPGGDSGVFSLAVLVTETEPDQPAGAAEPGNIGLAVVSMTLVPVGPGSPVDGTCSNGTVTGTGGYDTELPVTCTFDDVPVNTYTVDVTVDGGYYTGTGEDVLVVYDPSLGFTTGGGWFYWPGTNDRTNFGYTMKYNKRGTKVQGSLLLIRHLSDGSIYRLKSNALDGLSIGESADSSGPFGWASVTGKSTYLEPGWLEPIGNQDFLFYVEDRNEPGTGTDRFWIEAVGELVMSPPATENAVEINGGNIVAPHADASDLPPGVSITDPTDGSTVSGTIVITAEASDDSGVDQVEFFVDGDSLSVDTDGSDGWSSTAWDTENATEGDHVVSATATDTGGQTASDSVTVTVDNDSDLPLHVGDLDSSTSSGRGGKWNATVTITVHDDSHDPLANAAVSGSWSAGTSGAGSCATNGSGQCSITKSNIAKNSASATFTVDSVTLAGYAYDSGANHDPDADSDGTSIVVLKP